MMEYLLPIILFLALCRPRVYWNGMLMLPGDGRDYWWTWRGIQFHPAHKIRPDTCMVVMVCGPFTWKLTPR